MGCFVQVNDAFDQAAYRYEAEARMQAYVATRLDEALSWVKHQPKTWLDLGCGTGFLTEKMLLRYPGAQGFALDRAPGMLRVLEGKGHAVTSVLSDAHAMPFPDNHLDLVVSNLMLQWTDFKQVASEVFRVLKPGGLFVFSSLGPDTLKELRCSWAEADRALAAASGAALKQRVLSFSDMHDLGDVLRGMAFADIVMQADPIILDFASPMAVMRHVKAIGASALPGRASGLTTPRQLKACLAAYETFHDADRGVYPATFEVLYGHAWCPQKKPARSTFPLPVAGA